MSVVVTLYNYEHHIREALRSVAISDDRDHEVIVVDDASTDGSLAAARAALDEIPWLPAKVISRAHNGGLAAARNLGIAASRAPYVFILDADNAVYPHALDRLADALDADPGAAFAYGIIAQYAPTGPYGLLSWHRWSARRLAHGNFVDAMAMLRRSEVLAAGGYASDPRLHGWEDFALCCEFAESGRRGVLLPEIVARYRVAPHSMISVTNIDTAEAWAALAARYPMTTAALVDEPEHQRRQRVAARPRVYVVGQARAARSAFRPAIFAWLSRIRRSMTAVARFRRSSSLTVRARRSRRFATLSAARSFLSRPA